MVAKTALATDPGKPFLYYFLLHWLVGLFGRSEASVRGLSVFFGVASLVLLIAYGSELFGFPIGLTAGALWAFCPIAVVFARWARMYAMFVAFALAHLVVLSRLQRKANVGLWALGGVLGAAMLYCHFGAALIVAADALIIVRDYRRTGRSSTWPAVLLAIVLYLPFIPIEVRQTRALLFGHWLDWIGVGHGSMLARAGWAAGAVSAGLWLMLAERNTDQRGEAFHRCLVYAALPVVALMAGSAVIRPMLSPRYLGPSIAVSAIAGACLLDRAGSRIRNLAAFGLSALFLILVPLDYAGLRQPWRSIAALVAEDAQHGEPIVFESGFFTPKERLGKKTAGADSGFPRGFFRVPFDYYCHRHNPRYAIPGGNPVRARKLLRAWAEKDGGAWLISGKDLPGALAELPHGDRLQTERLGNFHRIFVFHIYRHRQPNSAG